RGGGKVSDGAGAENEYRVVGPDGSVGWMRVSVRGGGRPGGDTLQLDGILTDFTERKEYEDRLAEERHLLRTLMDNLPETIYCKDAQGHYLVDNVAHRTLLGVQTEEEVRGKTVHDFFPPEMADRYRADDAAVLHEGVAAQNREEVLDRESGKRYYSFTKVPMRDAAGKVSGLVCIGRDVTDQREAERALARERD